jgi:hypothetical protein
MKTCSSCGCENINGDHTSLISCKSAMALELEYNRPIVNQVKQFLKSLPICRIDTFDIRAFIDNLEVLINKKYGKEG